MIHRAWHFFARYWMLLILPIAVASVARIEIQNDHQADSIKANVVAVERATREVRRVTAENRSLTTSLQAAVVESCEQNGNARAKVQREQINEEIFENEHPNPQAFKALTDAGVSAQAIHEAEARAIVKLKERRARVKLVNCEKEYQISPGSGQRRRGSPQN